MEEEWRFEREEELLSSGHGSGETFVEDPTTLEHIQEEVEDAAGFMDKDISNKVNSKGKFSMPVKLPASEIFIPVTFSIVIWSKIGSALGS